MGFVLRGSAEAFSELVALQQTVDRNEGVRHVKIWRKSSCAAYFECLVLCLSFPSLEWSMR